MLLLLSRLCSSGNNRCVRTKVDERSLWDYEVMLLPVRAALRENNLPGRKRRLLRGKTKQDDLCDVQYTGTCTIAAVRTFEDFLSVFNSSGLQQQQQGSSLYQMVQQQNTFKQSTLTLSSYPYAQRTETPQEPPPRQASNMRG